MIELPPEGLFEHLTGVAAQLEALEAYREKFPASDDMVQTQIEGILSTIPENMLADLSTARTLMVVMMFQ